ncbi:MAG TPA: regulatory iron-sulfur-containing complex subunit RicT [Gaiellaceae bacterium]|jgi:cell fate regulator YaaT (PSP1 superfamily)
MATAVGVVFSPGGKVYSFDPDGLDLHWNTKVICHTSRGQELGRVVQPNYELETRPPQPLKRVVRRATAADEETAVENKAEARRAMKVLRELVRTQELELKPVSAELVFDGSRLVFSYQSEERLDLAGLQEALRVRLDRRVELRSVGPRECARLCGDHGLCGDQHCCRKFPSHEQPITLRMAKDQELPMSSGRITGLCGRLRCCLAFEHPAYKSFRDRAPRMGRQVHTPQGGGVVTAYQVLEDTCTVEIDGGDSFDVAIDECREVA